MDTIRAAILSEVKRQDITLADLARAVDIPPKHIYWIVSGKRQLSSELVSAMFYALDLRVIRKRK